MRLRGHVERLAGEIGERNIWRYAALQAAADYIAERFAALGYRVEKQYYLVEGKRVVNLQAEIRGSARPEEILLIGAHYDSVVGTPGANDNASGVAALLELAEQFAGQPQQRTLRLVAFTCEEPPFFKTEQMGSRVYARQAAQRGEKIVAMLCLETLGYYSRAPLSQHFPLPAMGFFYPYRGNFIAFVTNFSSARLLRRSLASFRRHSAFPAEGLAGPAALPGVDWSDHWSFWQEGYPALMLTDTAPYRYPHYHRAEDRPEQLSYPEFAQVVEGVVALVSELAN